MKSANILSLSEKLEKTVINEYKKYLGISIKDDELECLRQLCFIFQSKGSPIGTYNDFYISYNIPQISKEFDLLRIGRNAVVNIELKKNASADKILYQLIKNEYYLSYLDIPTLLFTFVTDTQKIYKLSKEKQLEIIDVEYLISVLNSQENIYTKNLDKLFNPANYLVSPFNSTDKFLENKYFLTGQQERIEKDIKSSFQKSSGNIIAIEGKPGTGKTLLLYDLATKFMNSEQNVLIIHVGILNDGQNILNSNYGWNIKPIKSIYFLLENAINNIGKCKYDIVIVDEAQRINILQLNKIIQFIQDNMLNSVIGYDPAQTLCFEEKNSKAIPTIEDNCTNKFELTEKIRTNKNLAQFIKSMFDLKKKQNILIEDVSLTHFLDEDVAKEYISSKNDYTFINFTPSIYNNSRIDKFQSIETRQGTSHTVIGQEFDNVVVIIDNIFYYDHNHELQSFGRRGNPYDQVKMLFQAITRVKRKLEIVVVNNPKVFEQLLKINCPNI